MQVTLVYNDPKSLTVEEIVRNARDQFGNAAKVTVGPDSSTPHDHIMHGIQCIITHRQISLLFDRGSNYPVEIKTLRAEMLHELEELLDQVILENEQRVE